MTEQARLTTPGDIIASVPALLGHTPSNVTVFLVTEDKAVKVAGACHPDDPDPAYNLTDALSKIGRNLTGETQLFLIDFGMGSGIPSLDVPVDHWWCTDGDEWWCKDIMCADCGPMPVAMPTAPPVPVVEAVADGQVVSQSRAQALAHLDPAITAWTNEQVQAAAAVASSASLDELLVQVEVKPDMSVLAACMAKTLEDGLARDRMYAVYVAAREAGVLHDMLDDLDLLAPHVPANQGEALIGTLALGHYLDGNGMAAQHLLMRCRPDVVEVVSLTRYMIENAISPNTVAAMLAHAIEEGE